MNLACPVLIKRLHGRGIIKAAAKHNLREIAAEIGVDGHIDPERILDNVILRGADTADSVARTARRLMDEAGIVKLRIDAVMGLELLFTLPSGRSVEIQKYFESATEWAESYYRVPVLSSVIHLDESAPHCHVLLLPLLDRKMVGSDLHGHASKLRAMQADFYEKVSSRYGFSRAPSKNRYTLMQRKEALLAARQKLQFNSALNDSLIDVLLEPHRKSPEPLMLALGLSMPERKAKKVESFVAMMTKPVKEEKNRRKQGDKSDLRSSAAMNENSELEPYSCVGFSLPIGLTRTGTTELSKRSACISNTYIQPPWTRSTPHWGEKIQRF